MKDCKGIQYPSCRKNHYISHYHIFPFNHYHPFHLLCKNTHCSWNWWSTPVIPATQEAEIRRIVVPGQPGKKKLSQTQPHQQAVDGGGMHIPSNVGALDRRIMV
jgi:hypothetical protein